MYLNFILLNILLPALLPASLIIGNEWLKRWFDKRREKQKLGLWKVILCFSRKPGTLCPAKELPLDTIYELLRDGLIEFDLSGDYVKIKREQLSSNTQQERYT